MSAFEFRPVDAFPEPDFAALSREAFRDFAMPSPQLADVLAAEAAGAGAPVAPGTAGLRIAVFAGERLVGWTHAVAEAGRVLHMVNSGVAVAFRRRGVSPAATPSSSRN